MFRRGLYLMAVLCGIFLFSIAHAQNDILASQIVETQQTTGNYIPGITQGYLQSLGNGFSGVLDQITFKYSVLESTTTNPEIDLYFYACTQNPTALNFGSYCTATGSKQYTNLNTAGTYQIFVGSDIGLPISPMDPTKYYAILVQSRFGQGTINGKNNIQFLGNNVDAYTSGTVTAQTGGASDVGSLMDLFFVLSGTATTYQHSYVYNLQPANGSTTPTEYVPLSFQYHANPVDNITRWTITLQDLTHASTSPIEIFGSASSGDHMLSQPLYLTGSTTYRFTANVCGTAYGGTCWGGPSTNFYVVYNTDNSSTTYGFVPGPNNILPNNTNITATSSGNDIISIIQRKVPFGYFTVLKQGFDQLIASSSATGTSMVYIGSFVAASPTLQGFFMTIRAFIAAGIWVLAAFMLIKIFPIFT